MELNADLRASERTPGHAPSGGGLRMPALAEGTSAHTHTIDSALVTLAALGVGAHRIQLRRIGRDARPAGAVIRQQPPAGAELGAATLIELDIVGLGFTQALPVGMWDSGGEAAAGTREILEAFDDPLEKLKHWFHEGAPLFRIAPDDLAACARWLRLFGLEPEQWPETMWYRLASVAANLPQMAGSEEGCALVLGMLLGLPVRELTYRPMLASMPESAISHLGAGASRLGVDFLLGDMVEDLALTVVHVGPVPLPVYERFVESEAGAGLLRRVLELLMPLSAGYDVDWLVQDPASPPQLGVAERNARLGINSHMGAALPVIPEAVLVSGPTTLDMAESALRIVG